MRSIKKMSPERARKTFEDLIQEKAFEKSKYEYFKLLLDEAVGNGSVSGNVRKLYEANGGESIFNNAKCDSFGRSVRNWLNGENLPPYIKNLERKQYLDILLFLGVHRRHEKDMLKGFNNDIGILGLENLYVLDYFDFCVAVAITLEEKNGVNAYVTYRQLCNDAELTKIANTTEAELSGTFTRAIAADFEKINTVGTLNDECSKNGANAQSAYYFVSKYAREFGRCHITRYFAYAALLCGCTIDDIVDILSRRQSQSTIGIREARTGETYHYSLNDIIQFALTSRQTQAGLYLLSEQMCVNCIKYLHKIDYVEYKSYVLDGKASTDNRCHLEEDELEMELNEIHDKFVQTDTKEIFDMPSADFEKVINNKENITREMMLATIMISLNSKTIKGCIDELGASQADTGATMEKKINKILKSCRMLNLNAELSKFDFLLLYAIHNVNYEQVVSSKKKIYPYREFIFYHFLNEELYRKAFSDIEIYDDDEEK